MSILCSPERLNEEMVRAGCGDVVVRAVEGAWDGPSVDKVMESLDLILRMMPLHAALDTEARARLSGPLRAAVEACVAPDGAVRVPAIAKYDWSSSNSNTVSSVVSPTWRKANGHVSEISDSFPPTPNSRNRRSAGAK